MFIIFLIVLSLVLIASCVLMAKQSFAGGFMGLFPEFRANLSPPHEVAAFLGTHPPEVLASMGTRLSERRDL